MDPETLLIALDLEGVCASTAQPAWSVRYIACACFVAMGLPMERARFPFDSRARSGQQPNKIKATGEAVLGNCRSPEHAEKARMPVARRLDWRLVLTASLSDTSRFRQSEGGTPARCRS